MPKCTHAQERRKRAAWNRCMADLADYRERAGKPVTMEQYSRRYFGEIPKPAPSLGIFDRTLVRLLSRKG